MNTSMEKKALVVIVVAVILAVAGFFYWKTYYRPPVREGASVGATSTDLGSELYRQANNPLQGALPSSTAPAPNPIKNLYKNPFQ